MTDREHRGTTSSESDKSGAAAATPATLLEMRHLTSDPHLQQRDLPLDSMRMWAMSFAPMMFHRTPEQIEQSDPDTYNLVLLRAGTMRRVDATSEMTYGPGDMHVNDSSLPFQLEAHGCHMVSCIGVEVPKRLLPLPNDRVAALVGRKLSAREGMGGLLATVLDHLITGHGSYRSTDAPRLAVVLRETLAGLFARTLQDEEQYVPTAAYRRDLLLRMRMFIDQHLSDPELGPRLIAAAHNVSISYVHRLFGDDGTTVAGWIRARRLERARRDLCDPAMRIVPVHHIAARWGFSHHAAFTRAFRTAYGVAPRDFRRAALPQTKWRERQKIEDAVPTTSPVVHTNMVSRQ
jgi:AraC-like DNA-binding protein